MPIWQTLLVDFIILACQRFPTVDCTDDVPSKLCAASGHCENSETSDSGVLLQIGHRSNRTANPNTEGGVDETYNYDEGNSQPATGILFLKMIRVGGELFSNIISEYAFKNSWRVLQHRDCSEATNPLGQATCECGTHFIRREDLPPVPSNGTSNDSRYAALYTHMHYNEDVMTSYLVTGAVRLTILRHPLSVLRSAHAMAAVQAVKQPWTNNTFCQRLAHDGDAWRDRCELGRSADSLLDYLDPLANEKLNLLLSLDVPREKIHPQAMAIIDDVTKQLENFTVGIQEEYDASMLLFQKVLGWSRGDVLYNLHDESSHEYHGVEVEDALESWGFGTPRVVPIVEKLRRGVFYYHELLYQRGVEIHRKQIREKLGPKAKVDAEVRKYRHQLETFTKCRRHELARFECTKCKNVCQRKGLPLHVIARDHCARIAEKSSKNLVQDADDVQYADDFLERVA